MMLKDAMVARAGKYNHFQKAEQRDNRHACSSCVRRQLSYPYTCNDGWPCGDPKWKDQGRDCINWTDDVKGCKVD